MRSPTAVVAVAALLVLSACTAEAEPEESEVTTSAEASVEPTTEAESPTPEAETSDPLADAVAAIGCTGWALSADPAPFVDAWGTCDLDGSAVRVYLIPDDESYTSFTESVADAGITEAELVRSGPIVAAPSDQTQLETIRSALG